MRQTTKIYAPFILYKLGIYLFSKLLIVFDINFKMKYNIFRLGYIDKGLKANVPEVPNILNILTMLKVYGFHKL